MNKHRQNLTVGGFVIVVATLLIGVWLWMSSNNRQSYNIYLTVFHEPVDGLSDNSIIKYNGVEVGRVKSIKLDSKNPRNIYVYLNILQNIPINKSTTASIKSQGITGMSYVDLFLPKDANLANNLVPQNKEPYPEIQTKTSFLYSLSEQAQSFTNNIQDVSSQIKTMLNNQNIDHITRVLANLDKISTALGAKTQQMGQSIDTLAEILNSVKSNTENLNKTFQDLSVLSRTLTETSKNANSLIVDTQNNTLQDINGVLLPNMNQAIINMNQSSYQLQKFLKLLNQNPSVLVRGKTPVAAGPGE